MGEFSTEAMNRTWDLSNDAYPAILEKQRQLELERARVREQMKRSQSRWSRFMSWLAGD